MTSSARWPPVSQSRWRLSTHGLCPPISYRSCSFVIVVLLVPLSSVRRRAPAGRSAPPGRHEGGGPVGDVVGGEPELGQDDRRRARTRRTCRSRPSRRRSGPSRTTPRPRPPASGRPAAGRPPGTRRPGPRTTPSTAARRPSPGRLARRAAAAASTQTWTSLPVPIRTTSGAPASPSSTSTYPPRAKPSGARSAVSARTGIVLPGQDQRGRLVAVHGHPPGLRGLVGVGRPDHLEAGHRPQRRQLLDRLVGRAVLAEADRVVRPRVDDVGPRQRGQPDRRRACSR